ncbi:DNA ligase 6 isoform X2 [Selaginella moellendorffii]|uniref:DNA ligase 6 isoform X2 n=1 Tax=Selaginella moellendorffii TaxID=88036 RepID=UPI000D1D0D5B|nr:DNA ligase 6 isoform X2 [Selaginella moellendorffii]|eukprot:XP_024532635.1 DNA ligase 6 isoform X2 [Selaginella moellendorffii]
MVALSSLDLWRRASASGDGASGGGGHSYSRFPSDFPFHKRIPGTRFVVDGFGAQCAGDWSRAYFLTHFHGDHYAGLAPSWDKGMIFCSQVTGRLVVEALGVRRDFVVELAMNSVIWIDECQVTLVDANHCPGAVQFLVEVPEHGTRFVHTGDMRFTPVMKEDASLCNFVGADAVFLDTTYCNPKFVFPAQEESISYIAETIERMMLEEERSQQRTLFLISTYVIGKEKILLAVAERCKCMIYVNEKKLALLKCLDLGEQAILCFTTDQARSSVHVVGWNVLGETWPFFRPNFSNMEMLCLENKVDRVVGFVPTGWTHEATFPVRKRGSLEIHLVPCSEHSNYEELREYVGFVRPREVFPTVGLDDKGMDSKTADAMKKHFRNLVDETGSKRKFLKGFNRKATNKTPEVENEDCSEHLTAFGRNARRRSREDFEQNDGSNDISNENIETKMQLKSVLPESVSDTQIEKLLLEASGDLNAAVALFCKQHASPERKDTGTTITLRSCSSQSAKGPKHPPATPPPGRPTKVPTINKSRGSKSKTKNALISGQRSLLSFFKKESASSEATESRSSGTTTDQKVKQLVTMLEVSEPSALALLEKGGGDIAAALDLHFNSANISQVPAITLKDCNEENLQDPSTAVAVETIDDMSEGRLDGNVSSGRLSQPKESSRATYVALPLNSYDPVHHACWKADELAPYLHLARTFELVEKESGRNRTTEMLCNMFRSLLALSSADVLAALYLTTNRIAPDYENVDLSIGTATVVMAIEEATGTPKSKLKEMYNRMGDLGDVAQACKQTQSMLRNPQPLLIRHVFSTLKQISKETGIGSSSRKKNMVVGLLRSCREKEVTYLVRTLNMRIGAMVRTVLPALAEAVVLHRDNSAVAALKHQEVSALIVEAFNLVPNFDILVPFLLEQGMVALATRMVLTPGIPIKPMLAKIANGVPDVLKIFEGKSFTSEFKYDGFRAQIHLLDDGSVRIFSRNCENSTSRFPDVVEIIKSSTIKRDSRSFIIDAELVAVDRANNNKLMAFQSLSTRERGGRTGTGVDLDKITVNVCVFVFDVMYVDGEPLVKAPLRLRRRRMHDLFPEVRPGYLDFAAEKTFTPEEHNTEHIQDFLGQAIAASCEGLMVKALDEGSFYAPAKRAESWLKLKRDYVEGLSDSLDLVPIGAWYGNGRKAGWHSPFLLACYDPDQCPASPTPFTSR